MGFVRDHHTIWSSYASFFMKGRPGHVLTILNMETFLSPMTYLRMTLEAQRIENNKFCWIGCLTNALGALVNKVRLSIGFLTLGTVICTLCGLATDWQSTLRHENPTGSRATINGNANKCCCAHINCHHNLHIDMEEKTKDSVARMISLQCSHPVEEPIRDEMTW